ncbi:MAG TPA: DTW domain-containing protein [Kofleriaceae bacterium]|nr:DTW domain-containing protein [Kofleriaceae bacterium]
MPPRPGRCPRCFLQLHLCLCAEVRPIDNRTHVVVLRHWLESGKNSNTARIAALALARCSVHDLGRDLPAEQVDRLATPGTWLLFPDGPALTTAPSPPPARLLVLDGSWHQARHMRQKLHGLRGLPVLCLPPAPAPVERLRRPPRQGALATIEAIAAALALLEGEAPAAALRDLYALQVTRSRISGRGF